MGMFHFNFGSLKTLVRVTEMTRLNKISLIGTFVLFSNVFINIEYNL
jgi:hypothetical protein